MSACTARDKSKWEGSYAPQLARQTYYLPLIATFLNHHQKILTMAVAPLEETVRKINVLIVEDNEEHRIFYQAYLESEYLNLQIVQSIPEACQVLVIDRFVPDVVISDFKIEDEYIGNNFLGSIEMSYPSCYRILASAKNRDEMFDTSKAQNFFLKLGSWRILSDLINSSYQTNQS